MASERSFVEAFRDAREEHGYTQGELASLLGISRQLVTKWESGGCEPHHSYWKAIHESIGLNPADYLAPSLCLGIVPSQDSDIEAPSPRKPVAGGELGEELELAQKAFRNALSYLLRDYGSPGDQTDERYLELAVMALRDEDSDSNDKIITPLDQIFIEIETGWKLRPKVTQREFEIMRSYHVARYIASFEPSFERVATKLVRRDGICPYDIRQIDGSRGFNQTEDDSLFEWKLFRSFPKDVCEAAVRREVSTCRDRIGRGRPVS